MSHRDLTGLAIEDRMVAAYNLMRDRALAAGREPPSTEDPDTIERVHKIVVAQVLLDKIELDREGEARRAAAELERAQELRREAGTRDEYGRPFVHRFGHGPGLWWLEKE